MSARLVALVSLLFANDVQAQPNQGESGQPLRRISEFWSLPQPLREKALPADFVVSVRYFDPDWGLLWGENEGESFFLPIAKIELPMKNGDRVRLRGRLSATSFIADPDEIEQLAPAPPPKGAEVTDLSEKELARLNNKPVEGRAYIESQEQIDERHLAYRAILSGRLVNVWLRTPPDGGPSPVLVGAMARFRGVCTTKTDPNGALLNAEFWLGSTDDLRYDGSLGEDRNFNLPATPAEKLREQQPGKLVRVAGRVRVQEPGYSLALWDETGQVTVETAQTSKLRPGTAVEAIGYPVTEGASVKLVRALYRPLEKPEAVLGAKGPQPGVPLRLVEQVTELSASEAANNRPVRLTGVVVWAPKRTGDAFYLQDATEGIKVVREEDDALPLWTGDLVDIEGVSGAGKDAPIVRSRHISKQTGAFMPKPVAVTLEQARAGVGFSKRVEISGFLREIEPLPNGSVRLWLTTASGDFSARLPEAGGISEFLNALVSVQGVCTSASEAKRKLADVEILASSAKDVSLVGVRPADLFSLPFTRLADLVQTGVFSAKSQWVRTQGTVTLTRPGQFLVIQDGDASLQVRCRKTELPNPGDQIDVVGLFGHEQTRYTLREALYRLNGPGAAIQPVVLQAPLEMRPELDGCLVKIRGELVERSRHPEGLMLVLRLGESLCEAWLDDPFLKDKDDSTSAWRHGSVLEATGVYLLVRDELHRPWSFRVILRNPADVKLLSSPPWWTIGRALVALGAFAILAATVLLWSALLRRKVKNQTGVIREQMLKESRLIAELERSSRLESLGTLAGGIAHDFNNILTIIICNLSLLRQESGLTDNARGLISEAENGANRAKVLTKQLLTFARGGNPIRKPHKLEPLLRDAVKQAVGGARLSCVFDLAPELWPVSVDGEQFAQAMLAILSRGVESMSPGGSFRIAATNVDVAEGQFAALQPGPYVKLVIEDEGGALSAEQTERIFDPYFLMKGDEHGMGLATARSIIKRHEGGIEAHALGERGMAFHLWLPAAEALEAQAEKKPREAGKDLSSSRILFMDDEEPIQLIASALFRRMGCEATIVGEGSQALAAFEEARAQGKPFDLVIVDLIIPDGMGGRELIEQLLRIDPSLRAIVSSGYSNDPVLANYAEYGFVAVVPKPYLIEDMEQAIRLALASPPPSGRTVG